MADGVLGSRLTRQLGDCRGCSTVAPGPGLHPPPPSARAAEKMETVQSGWQAGSAGNKEGGLANMRMNAYLPT